MKRLAVLALVIATAACGRIGFGATGGDAHGGTPDAAPDAVAIPGGLIAYYPMDALATGITPDATGHLHDAYCQMQPPPAGECPTLVSGRIGGALAFDGATEILRVSSTTELDTTAGFTVAAWVRIGAVPAARACFATKGLGTGIYNAWAACIETSQQIFFYTVTGSTPDNLFSTATVSVGAWHHVAIRWDGAQKTIWLDGAEVGSDAAVTDFDDQPIYIGSDIDNGGFAAPFAGDVDDLRIYNRPLLPAELAQLASP